VFYRDIDDASLETVMKVLTGMKAVRIIERIPKENDTVYEYVGKTAEIIKMPKKEESDG